MSAAQVLEAWHDAARRLLPAEAAVWDAHTHTGQHDPDGRQAQAEELLGALDEAGHAGAVVISNANPAGYVDANDRILEEAQASDGRLIPFCRVDPNVGAVAEVERSLDRGHKGIKLHPRAEAFGMDTPGVASVASLAAERGVPILVHAGRGIPPLGKATVGLLERFEGLVMILAHCAISDLSRLGPIAKDVPGLYFDTAWWDITDRLALSAWVPPHRIVYASDTPYGWPNLGFTMAIRTALSSGYSDDQLTALFGGTLHRVLDGAPVNDVGMPTGSETGASDLGLVRVHASIHGAITSSFAGGNPSEPISLARLACEVPPGTAHEQVYRAVGRTLDAVDPYETGGRTTFDLLVTAAAATLTPDVPVPDLF